LDQAATFINMSILTCVGLSSTLYIFGSGPGPEDAFVRDERERFVEGHDDAAHVIDILPFAPV
jgi:hypothetical protein